MLTNDNEEWHLIIYKRIWMFFLGSQKKPTSFLIMEVTLSHSSSLWVIWKIQRSSEGNKNFHNPKITTVNTLVYFLPIYIYICVK